jgi:uncharacterized protein (DUF427 family)
MSGCCLVDAPNSSNDARDAGSYRTPLPESAKIAGLIAFYNEKVDLYVDGVRESLS